MDWALITSSVILTAYMVWVLMDDPVNRRIHVVYRLTNIYRSVAMYFGQRALESELAYMEMVERQRTF